MKKIILIGGGGHCKSCIDIIEKTKNFEIVGIIDLKEKVNSKVFDYSVIGTDEDIMKLSKLTDYFFITMGQIGKPKKRKELFNYLKKSQLPIATIVSPHAVIGKGVSIGDGSIIMHNAIINTEAKIGENCIINSRALVEHESEVGDSCHISTGVILNGEVKVGCDCFIGSNVTVNLQVSIADNTIVGSSSLITKSISSSGVYKGVPVNV